MNYIENVQNKRRVTNEQEEAKKLLDNFLDKVKANAYDDTEIRTELNKVGEALSKLSESMPKDNTEAIVKLVEGIQKAIEDNKPQLNTSKLENLLERLLKKKTDFTVTAPDVNIQNEVDLSPIVEAIQTANTEDEEIDLDDYYAHDIIEKDGYQYIGFLNKSGGWYIIQNNYKDESLRYIFGTTDYAKNFKKANLFVYKTLDEAVNEVRT